MSSNEPGRPAPLPRPSVREWIAVFVTGSAFFMTVLDTSIVNLALPVVARDLQLSLVGLQWVVDGYTMVFASFLLGAGALGDRYGAKRLFLAGLALFAFASGFCVLAQGSMTLQVARLLQGLGAAMLLPASLAVLSHTVKDPKRRMRAISAWAAAGALGMALGPVIGGISVEFFGWRSIFAINIPVGFAGFWLAFRHLDDIPAGRRGRFDLLGQAFAVLSLCALTYTLIQSNHDGLIASTTICSAILFVVGTTAFLLTETFAKEPMLPLGFFRFQGFGSTAAVGLLHNIGIYGLIFVLSIFFQQLRHAGPLVAGLMFLPLTGALAAGTRIGSKLLQAYGPAWVLVGGHLAASIGALAGAVLGVTEDQTLLSIALVAIGLGAGVTTPAMSVSILDSVDRSHSGLASGLLNAARQTGSVIGVAVLGALVEEPATASGTRAALFAAAIALAAAAIVALWRATQEIPLAAMSKNP